MVLYFSKVSAQLVRNLVELGVCDDKHCLNSYHSPVECHIQASFLDSSWHASTFPLQRFQGSTSTTAVLPVREEELMAVLHSDEFPLAEVSQQLSSSESQMSRPLTTFIDSLFHRVSRKYTVRLETLVRALRLLELVQLASIRAHQRQLVALSSLTSGSDSPCCCDGDGCALKGAEASLVTTRSSTMIFGSRSRQRSAPPRSLRPESEKSPACAVTPTLTIPAFRMGYAGQRWGCKTAARALPPQTVTTATFMENILTPSSSLHTLSHLSAPHGSQLDDSSVSSGTVGPLTVTGGASLHKKTTPVPSPSLSWYLPASPTSVLPDRCSGSNAVDLTSLLSLLHHCSVCRGARVFALQYYNVHLFLSACLVLSISINEMELLQSIPECVLVRELADLSQCTELLLRVAMRAVCETLEGRLCVLDSDVQLLLHRLKVLGGGACAAEEL